MSLCLTHDELVTLTGRTYAAYQIAWLTARGWKFEVGADGKPKVARSYFEARMGTPAPKRRRPKLEGLSA